MRSPISYYNEIGNLTLIHTEIAKMRSGFSLVIDAVLLKLPHSLCTSVNDQSEARPPASMTNHKPDLILAISVRIKHPFCVTRSPISS